MTAPDIPDNSNPERLILWKGSLYLPLQSRVKSRMSCDMETCHKGDGETERYRGGTEVSKYCVTYKLIGEPWYERGVRLGE